MSDSSFQLYAFWRTSATYRVRVALALKGLKAEETIVDLEKGEQRDPDFLKINPMGAIPALVVSETSEPLTQSLAILEYLEETAPHPPLLPADPLGRARVRSLSLLLAADTHPLIVPRVRKVLAEEYGFDAATIKGWQARWFTAGLQAFEKRLVSESGTGEFCHGDQVTLADICLCSITAVTNVLGIEVPDVPTVTRIAARCNELAAFADADPFKQKGAPAR